MPSPLRIIYVMPAIGGPSNRISSRASGRYYTAQWSSDGRELAAILLDNEARPFIEIVSLSTRETRRLRIPAVGAHFDLSWSPDRRFFAYVRSASGRYGASRLWVLRASDAQAFPVTDELRMELGHRLRTSRRARQEEN